MESNSKLPQTKRADHPRVAVVVLNWNGKAYLERFLPSVLASAWPNLEVVVADNCSTDDSVAFVQKTYPQITIVQNEHNRGFAEGYNTALKQVESDYYVLLNQDVEVTPNWIGQVMQCILSDPLIAAAAPKLLDERQRDHFEYAGAGGGQLDFLGYPFCRGRIFDTLETDNGQYDNSQEIFWASGASMFIRADLYHAIGGLDPDFFAHMEEIDLCWRLRKAGYIIMYCGNSHVYHIGGGSLARNDPRKTYLNFRNNLRMVHKNFRGPRLLWLLPLRFILDHLAIVNELRQGKFGDALAIFRAVWSFIFKLPYYHKRRRHYRQLTDRIRIGPDRTNAAGYYRNSVVWQYFGRGKTRYRNLKGIHSANGH